MNRKNKNLISLGFIILIAVIGINNFWPKNQALVPINNTPAVDSIEFEKPNVTPIKECPKPAAAPEPAQLIPPIYHLQYPEAKSSDIVEVGGGERLHRDAANAFKQMQNAALKDGVSLTVISGFRSISDQKSIVSRKIADGYSSKKIYSVSSAPGYSEHHTGYALDINSLETSFGDTKAGQWLRANALSFGFEMSFDRGNFQNISYEPWHFRFIGTPEAKKMFCYASSKK